MWRWILVAFTPGLVGCEIFDGPFGPGDGPTGFQANNVQAQVFEGTVDLDSLTDVDPSAAIPSFESGNLETVAQVFARPPLGDGGPPDGIAAPGVEQGYLERWVYRDAAVDEGLNQTGFLMRLSGDSQATCAEIEASVASNKWADAIFSEQVLEYVEPPDMAVEALEGTDEALEFEVYQPEGDEVELRGWMFRTLPPNARSTDQQDHWLLTEDYEPLGDGGTYAIVIPVGATSVSALGEWYGSLSGDASSYAVTDYPKESFPEGCVD